MRVVFNSIVVAFGVFMIFLIASIFLTGCNKEEAKHLADGWYPVADNPDNTIIGKPLATVKDFERVVLQRDTFVIDGDIVIRMYIAGKIKPEKRKSWADGTESLIGHRLGFVFKYSVIMAPTINTRMESGSFEIVSPDTILLKRIYQSISKQSHHK